MKSLAGILILLLTYHVSFACTCEGKETVHEAVKHSDIVFVGKMLSKRVFSITHKKMPSLKVMMAEYTFLVKKTYKGKVKTDTIELTTPLDQMACGFQFVKDVEYIIYGSYRTRYYMDGDTVGEFLYTDLCTQTTLSVKSELEELH